MNATTTHGLAADRNGASQHAGPKTQVRNQWTARTATGWAV